MAVKVPCAHGCEGADLLVRRRCPASTLCCTSLSRCNTPTKSARRLQQKAAKSAVVRTLQRKAAESARREGVGDVRRSFPRRCCWPRRKELRTLRIFQTPLIFTPPGDVSTMRTGWPTQARPPSLAPQPGHEEISRVKGGMHVRLINPPTTATFPHCS